MMRYQQVLLESLSSNQTSINMNPLLTLTSPSSSTLGDFFVSNAFLGSALEFLRDEEWLQKKAHADFGLFLIEAFNSELQPIAFLQGLITASDKKELRRLAEKSHEIERAVISLIKAQPPQTQKEFSIRVFELMAVHFKTENQQKQDDSNHGLGLGLTLYRTFDGMDEVFGLTYVADEGMKATSKERLYEGAGIGVQSSYSTLLNALREINPARGTRFIDLGSGYGRAGLVIGLLRPDIDFIGYEYVPHRVEIANSSVKNFNMQSHVHFYAQDLAALDFKVPEADIYYMYDPFTKETYKYVLDQLQEIGRHRRITIATKGNARDWMDEFSNRAGWLPVQEMDGGNLCLYRSK
ncbi:MAG: SAM-dependent methyltransferase [Bdellovibrionales bacterium]|nr:SAM-dependent methyltransferase [Bdellovibrionales bacterium]